jgi:hypothetical protein
LARSSRVSRPRPAGIAGVRRADERLHRVSDRPGGQPLGEQVGGCLVGGLAAAGGLGFRRRCTVSVMTPGWALQAECAVPWPDAGAAREEGRDAAASTPTCASIASASALASGQLSEPGQTGRLTRNRR